MDNSTLLFIIFAIAAGTLLLRISFIYILSGMDMPPLLERALKFVPAAALAALVFPAILRPEGQLDLTIYNERIVGGIMAAAAAYFTKNFFLTVASGMITLWLLRFVL